MYGFGLTARNVCEALPLALSLIKQVGVPVVSRGLNTLECPGPVMTVYNNPCENVLRDPVRDANPFFHFFESMWILAGSDTVALPSFFLNSLLQFSDDGHRFHGAYGKRLRSWMGKDQLGTIADLLQRKPDTRQAVASIWDPMSDLCADTKDTPCNDMLMFKVRDGKLNMTVCNRSNDAIWGAYGANAVQFSIIQQYVAARAGFEVGKYTQISDSLHVYTELPLWQQYMEGTWQPSGHVVNPYEGDTYGNLFRDADEAEHFVTDCLDLNKMAEQGQLERVAMWAAPAWRSVVGRYVARPMFIAFMAHKKKDYMSAISAAEQIARPDWRVACVEWLQRRAAKA